MQLTPVQDQAIAARMALIIGGATFDQRKLAADRRAHLQDLLVRRCEPIDARADHGLNRRRQGLGRQLPECLVVTRPAAEFAAIDQRADELLGKERIAAASLDDAVANRDGRRVIADQIARQGGHVLIAEFIEPQLPKPGAIGPGRLIGRPIVRWMRGMKQGRSSDPARRCIENCRARCRQGG